MAPRMLSLQNYGENLCMRAIRDGASRAGKSCSALLALRTALCEMRTETTLLLYKSWLFGQNEWGKWTLANFITRKKKGGGEEKAQWSYDKILIDWLWAKYFSARPSHSVNKYILFNFSCQYFSTDVMAKLSVRVRRHLRGLLKSQVISLSGILETIYLLG